jgi:two-component system response regulator NreC
MAEPRGRIRILLADDHPVIREGLRDCLGAAPHIEVVAEAADGREALREARRVGPDVVVMDVNMPRMNGLAATAELVRRQPEARVLMLTLHEHSEYVMEIMRAGARGYLSKQAALAEIIRAIETVAAGGTHFGVAETVRYLRRHRATPGKGMTAAQQDLSEREREVLARVAEGLSNREIAARLKVAQRTVETYRERLMRKLDLHDATALRVHAMARGLMQKGLYVSTLPVLTTPENGPTRI